MFNTAFTEIYDIFVPSISPLVEMLYAWGKRVETVMVRSHCYLVCQRGIRATSITTFWKSAIVSRFVFFNTSCFDRRLPSPPIHLT